MLTATAKLRCTLVLLLILCSLIGCQQKDNETTRIDPADSVNVESMVLLEQMVVNLGNQEEACIGLYTSAAISEDGLMGWDTGDQWLISVDYNDQSFVIFDEYV